MVVTLCVFIGMDVNYSNTMVNNEGEGEDRRSVNHA